MSESPLNQTDRVLLRTSDIKRWSDEIDKLLGERKEIEEKIQRLKRQLDAAAFLSDTAVMKQGAVKAAPIGVAQETDTAGSVNIHVGDESMPSAAERIILNAGKLLSHMEIQSSLKKIPDYRERLEQNPNYYYTVIGRLLKRKKIAKRGRKYGPPLPKNENAKDADHV